jgi:hypothetical protein
LTVKTKTRTPNHKKKQQTKKIRNTLLSQSTNTKNN